MDPFDMLFVVSLGDHESRPAHQPEERPPAQDEHQHAEADDPAWDSSRHDRNLADLGRRLLNHGGLPLNLVGRLRENSWQRRSSVQFLIEDGAEEILQQCHLLHW